MGPQSSRPSPEHGVVIAKSLFRLEHRSQLCRPNPGRRRTRRIAPRCGPSGRPPGGRLGQSGRRPTRPRAASGLLFSQRHFAVHAVEVDLAGVPRQRADPHFGREQVRRPGRTRGFHLDLVTFVSILITFLLLLYHPSPAVESKVIDLFLI